MQKDQPARYTKQLLYREVSNFRQYLGINETCYPLNARALLIDGGFSVYAIDFKTHGLKGMLAITEKNGFVFVDSKSSDFEQNFFCGHEAMHFALHRNIGNSSFQCYESGVKSIQNPIIEWQANEGSAELLVPYKLFIPDLLELFNPLTSFGDMFSATYILSEKYHVSEMVIRNRTENLKYEIYQVASGTSIDKIKIMSRNQQEICMIDVPSCWDVEMGKL